LGDADVNILDPCTGTGNFIVNLMRRIPKKDLPRMYKEQLFANEVMLMPYYIAALNIEHTYYELTGVYEPFEGLCFVDTLEMAERPQSQFAFMTETNTRRVERQKEAKITVIIGNPPYNAHQVNENDNNKNRKYEMIDKRISETYAKDSNASNKNALSDMYVKFFRWAVDRLLPRNGIVCFVSNNSFVDQIAFDGMRKRVTEDFTRIYHLDLHGNVRHNPKLSGTTHNVFGIQVGVGITVAARHVKHRDTLIRYHRVPQDWRREEKCEFLEDKVAISGVKWKILEPDDRNRWLVPENGDEFAGFVPIGSRQAKAGQTGEGKTIFSLYGRGVATCRDEFVYDFDHATLCARVQQFVEDYNSEVDRYRRSGGKGKIDDFVRYKPVKWSESLKLNLKRGVYAHWDEHLVRPAMYRPFQKRYLFFDSVLNERRYQMPRMFPTPATEGENRAIALTDLGSEKPFMAMMAAEICDLHLVSAGCQTQCFPFYVYDEDGTKRRENISDWALEEFRKQYKSNKISKWDIFYYVYGILHDPGYRGKFADNLKRELPRIPLAKPRAFSAFAAAGKKLAQLHLDYEKLEPWPLKWLETQGTPLSYRVEKMKLNKEKTVLRVNDSLSLAGIPPEVFEYRLGNRSALEWVIDQYQVSEDKRSGIKSDPNRPDDAEYIVRLVGQVVRVSVETVKIVKGLPKEYGAVSERIPGTPQLSPALPKIR
ncbi:MAG: type ISP restriction/modification enzyme, partial [Planctomycetota bacterium]